MRLTVLLMVLAVTLLAAVALALALRGLWLGQKRLRHTTLKPACRWAISAAGMWSLGVGLSSAGDVSATTQDALWYATALLSLCPAISVLGARRPGAGVWNAFVIVPLLAVLGWPLLTLWAAGGALPALRLQTPQLVGFVLVLLMGAGNYMGTRFSVPAALYVVALCLLVGTVSSVAPEWVQGSLIGRLLATICLGLAVTAARSLLRETVPASTMGPGEGAQDSAESPCPSEVGFDRLWSDYRETFGIVWARRFQDRLNGIAAQQQWPARLGDQGLQWQDPSGDRREVFERVDQTFRWLLRRFVDPEWIDERLTHAASRMTESDEQEHGR